MSAEVVAQAKRHVERGQHVHAVALLQGASDAGSSDARFELALWKLIGQATPRDLRGARRLLAAAGEAGHADAIAFSVALTANGSGAPPDWPAARRLLSRFASVSPSMRAQQHLIERMALDEAGWPLVRPEAVSLAGAGAVMHITAFATIEECAHVASVVQDIMAPAFVIDPATGRQIAHPVRTCDSAVVGPTREDLVIRTLNLRIADATGTNVSQGESLTVLRYDRGQEFKPHRDSIAGARNQRVLTVLLYLNDDYVGGETSFPDHGLTIRAKAGDAVIFKNVDADGKADPKSIHAGLPVSQGSKFVGSRWIRARPFSPWTGPDMPYDPAAG